MNKRLEAFAGLIRHEKSLSHLNEDLNTSEEVIRGGVIGFLKRCRTFRFGILQVTI